MARKSNSKRTYSKRRSRRMPLPSTPLSHLITPNGEERLCGNCKQTAIVYRSRAEAAKAKGITFTLSSMKFVACRDEEVGTIHLISRREAQ